MPGKGRKVAARQAQVGRRRRRQTREGVAINSDNSDAVLGVVVPGNDEDMSSVAIDPESPAINDQVRVRNPINNRGTRHVGIRDGQIISNSMVKSECLRISIMAGALTSVLVILAVLI